MSQNAQFANTLVVYGHVGFDVSVLAGTVSRTIGGAAYYAGMAAASQGAEVSLVTVLGSDFPQAALEIEGLDRSSTSWASGRSAIFTQEYDREQQIERFEASLNACSNLNPEQIPLSPGSPGAIFLTTAPPTQQQRALEWLHVQGYEGLIAVDTALAYVADFDTLVRKEEFSVGVLFVNAEEYEALSGRPLSCARTIVKRGSQGASLVEDGVWLDVPAPVAKQVRTVTGAGDVLAGAFLAGHLQGRSSIEALELAVAFATSFVESGTGCFRAVRGG